MLAQILAGLSFDHRVGQCGAGTDGAAEEGAAQDTRRRAQFVTGDLTIKGRHKGDMLKGVDDVEKVEEIEAVLAFALRRG